MPHLRSAFVPNLRIFTNNIAPPLCGYMMHSSPGSSHKLAIADAHSVQIEAKNFKARKSGAWLCTVIVR